MATIQYGPGNQVVRQIAHTDEVTDDIIAFLGGNPENVEIRVDGARYEGPVDAGTVIELVQRANSKA